MLRDFLEKLCIELAIESIPKLNEQKIYPLRLGDDLVAIKDLDPGVSLQAQICPCPQKKKEDLFIYLMRANLLGQGTGGTRIGLDLDEKFLTLSLGLPYELNYQTFKDTVEDFVNYLIYWRDEVAKFESEHSIY
ncbi:MAG: hypothetical protein COT85_08065 [Chlamydiae bacterium CG10_big_fil_rev_8_21_14_0_10_42_34]|nr:MAG: hypothetical protein COT85_08065 [Chlamydiae bacterium CG10_big_fil_rev_8_21_14_0_10_42_34]